LPLSTALDDSEFDNSGDGDGEGGGGGGPAAQRPATAAGEVVVGTFDGVGGVAASTAAIRQWTTARRWREGDVIRLWRWQMATVIDGCV